MGCLHRMWDGNIAAPLEGSFVDLGCGEGRVVIEIGARFSDRFEGGIGMDLQPDLIRQAKANARRRRLHNWCRFSVADLASVDLRGASVLFLYFPTRVIPAVLESVLRANLRDGTILISADGALRDAEGRLPAACSRSAAAVATATFTATPGAKYEYSSLCKGVVRCDDVIRTKPFTIRIPRWNSW